MVIIRTNFVGPKSPRSLVLWFQSRFLKGFYHKWAWWPSWSCDPDPLNKLSYVWKNAFISRDINTVMIITEKNATPCDITEYCIVGFKTIYSNIKFFILQLICILATIVITFEQDGIFSCAFQCCTQENKFCRLNYVCYSMLGTL